MDKILLMNKPAGMTSFDVVRQCRRILHEKKIGHTGTLDPEAQGFLIVLTGKYTKLLPFVVKDHKHYQARFLLGKRYDTQDIWGTLIQEKEWSFHEQEELDKASSCFLGKGMQIPPMYSAVKVNGKKLYEYARAGIEIERQPRPVEVSYLKVKHIADNEYSMDAVVSSGTYIRTLIEDYCSHLQEFGAMSYLLRSGIEEFDLSSAINLEDLTEDTPGISPLDILDPSLKKVDGTAFEKQIKDGKKIFLKDEEDKVVFVMVGAPLAVYEKVNGTMYRSVRGLF